MFLDCPNADPQSMAPRIPNEISLVNLFTSLNNSSHRAKKSGGPSIVLDHHMYYALASSSSLSELQCIYIVFILPSES